MRERRQRVRRPYFSVTTSDESRHSCSLRRNAELLKVMRNMTTAKSVVETIRQFVTLAKDRDSTAIPTVAFDHFVRDLEDAVSKNENPLEVITKARHEFE